MSRGFTHLNPLLYVGVNFLAISELRHYAKLLPDRLKWRMIARKLPSEAEVAKVSEAASTGGVLHIHWTFPRAGL